ncbi:sugar transferase [Microvirga antarctica]|uniref:sugar transferase n=1 Tax=Microvirga antarctica TaxID=2819233 RepID=UPI001B311726|nr:sugar transferase [Microvirga antarctica]
MAIVSKLPLREVVAEQVSQPAHVTATRPLRLIVWPAIAALGGLVSASQSAILFSTMLQASPRNVEFSATMLQVVGLNALAIIAIATFTRKQSTSRLLLAFTFSFLVHFVWFAYEESLHRAVSWTYVPWTYLAALACSLAVDAFRKVARPRRVGAIAVGAVPDLLRRLDSDVELITDPTSDASRYDVLLIDFSTVMPSEWAPFVSAAALADCELSHVRSYAVQRTSCLQSEDVEPQTIRRNLRMNSLYVPVKRCIDILAVFLLAPIALVLLTFAAAAIALTMGAPIFFTQNRVGQNGRVFRMYKLRTMRVAKPGALQIATSHGDMRITPLGKVLRRFRIDELPQLLNILKGEMSLIGPRPEQPELVQKYGQIVSNYDLRHAVQPGLSGWAQVTYGYASTVEETKTKLEYDLFYVREFSFAMDVEIVFATLWTLVSGRNVR